MKIYGAGRSSAKKSFHGKLKTAEDKTLMQVEAKTARNNGREAILQDGIPFSVFANAAVIRYTGNKINTLINYNYQSMAIV